MKTWRYLEKSIQNGELKNLYCLYGEETFLIDEAKKALIQLAVRESLLDFNRDVFFASETSSRDIKNALETLPIMASKRVVIVHNVDSIKIKELENLKPLIEKPIETSVLIFLAQTIDLRKAFFKLFQSKGVVVKFNRVSEKELPFWIDKFANQAGVSIRRGASELLQHMIGPYLLEIRNEIEKVAQFIGDRKQIERSDVESVVSNTRMESIFQLINAIGVRDRISALIYLNKLLKHGENVFGILALIARHFRVLLYIHEGLRFGFSKSQICLQAKIPMFSLPQYINQTRDWPPQKLGAFHKLLLETDQALKSSSLSQHLWLENLIVKIC